MINRTPLPHRSRRRTNGADGSFASSKVMGDVTLAAMAADRHLSGHVWPIHGYHRFCTNLEVKEDTARFIPSVLATNREVKEGHAPFTPRFCPQTER